MLKTGLAKGGDRRGSWELSGPTQHPPGRGLLRGRLLNNVDPYQGDNGDMSPQKPLVSMMVLALTGKPAPAGRPVCPALCPREQTAQAQVWCSWTEAALEREAALPLPRSPHRSAGTCTSGFQGRDANAPAAPRSVKVSGCHTRDPASQTRNTHTAPGPYSPRCTGFLVGKPELSTEPTEVRRALAQRGRSLASSIW